jgi:tetratricopeptide (TPR) repeat protein
MALNIFLSYGHDIVEDATRIYEDLKKAGHTVWFDKIDIDTGDDWLKRIEEGLKKTGFSANSRFVLLMTKHILRDDNGLYSITRNEIQAAINYQIPLFPVMIEFSNAPFNLNVYQYLDFRECIPIRDHETAYKKKFDILLTSLVKNNKKDFEYFLDLWLNNFCDAEIDKTLARKLERFTGRQWLIDILNDWLNKDNVKPVFCLQGNMGFGKSAFAAYIIKNHPDVLAYYFISFSTEARNDNFKTTLLKAFSHIIFQITVKYPKFWSYLKENKMPSLTAIAAAKDPNVTTVNDAIPLRSLLQELIINPLSQLDFEGNKRIVIILDAVDELKDDECQSLLDLISDTYRTFPKYFRLVLTSRHNKEISRMDYCIKSVDITDDATCADYNISDIRTFIAKELRLFNNNNDLLPEIIDVIVKKSEGVFLYLEYLIKYLSDPNRPQKITLEDAMEFPQGLNEVMTEYFDRVYVDKKYYFDHISKVLAVNFAAQNTLTLDEIITLFDFSEKESIGCEKKLGTLFICINNQIHPSSRFVYDWVTNKDNAGDYFIDLKKGHSILAEKGEAVWQKIKDKNISGSLGLSPLEEKLIFELPYHYVSFGNIKKLSEVMTEIGLCIHFFENDLLRFQLLTFFSEIKDPGTLLPEYKKRLKIFEKNNKTEIIARGYHVVGLIFFNLSIHIEAEYFFKKAEAFYKKDGNKAKIAHVYNDLGEIYYNQSNKIAEPVEDIDEFLKKPINRKAKLKKIFNILKIAFRVWRLVRKAKAYYEKAIDLRSKVLGKDHPETAESINNLGHAFLNLNKYAKSEAQYTMALEVREKVLLPFHKDITILG